MFDNYFFLKRLAKELEIELSDFRFHKAISQSRNELVINFYNDNREKFLIFTFQKLPPFLYIKDEFTFAKKNYARFFEKLNDNQIKAITIDSYERNIRLKFQDFSMIFLVRGSHSNVVLVDNNQTIIDSFKKSDEVINKNLNDVFPPSQIDYSFFEDENKFNSLFQDQSNERKIYFRILGNLLLEEIKFRAEKLSQNYFGAFKEIQNELQTSPLYIYNNEIISFYKLHHLSSQPVLSQNIFNDLSRIYFSIQRNEEIQTLKERLIKNLKADYERHFLKLQELKKPENFIDRTEEFRQSGNLILMKANEIKKGDKSVKILFNEKEYKIKLDPSKTPFQNAEEYFEKAREEESRLNSLRKLIILEEKNLEKIKLQIEEIENSINRKQLLKYMNEQNQQTKEKDITKNFRHFVIDGKYDVYVGKDNKSNDLLTTQFANPNDLWFHARGVSGSHVIIKISSKKELIPKKVIEQVASIAAYFSKAKHSKLVPVSYTEKKYVIKRKNMPPGTVQLQKEKVIMVEPKIPQN